MAKPKGNEKTVAKTNAAPVKEVKAKKVNTGPKEMKVPRGFARAKRRGNPCMIFRAT